MAVRAGVRMGRGGGGAVDPLFIGLPQNASAPGFATVECVNLHACPSMADICVYLCASVIALENS
eukprot:1065821-Pelagomonas_calceolata.AAC.2